MTVDASSLPLQTLQARQFALADYAASKQGARARLGLRYFTESVLFAFVPASVLQVAWLITVAVGTPTFDGKLARADFYLRMFNTIFSVNFGLLSVWWATGRIHALEARQSDAQLRSNGSVKPTTPHDMSLLDWALGPIEPEGDIIFTHDGSPAEKLDSLTAEAKEEHDVSLRCRRECPR